MLKNRVMVPALEDADVVLSGIDSLVPHYPSFLWECRRWPGGHQKFVEERCKRMGDFWFRLVPGHLERLSFDQRLLLFDLESNIMQCSAFAHEQKFRICGRDTRVVHVSICLDVKSYRAGVDISFPACLPKAFGTAAHRSIPPARRPLLFSFQGQGRNMPLRNAMLRMHNGRDVVCVDATAARQQVQDREQAASGVRVPPPSDERYVALHARSKFSLCPRGDAVYSFRMIEALSAGAVPVIYGDGWVLPFSEHPAVDYSTFAVCIAENDVIKTPAILRGLDEATVARMQARGREVFEQYFASVGEQLDAVLTIVRARRAAAAAGGAPGQAEERRHQVCDVLAGASSAVAAPRSGGGSPVSEAKAASAAAAAMSPTPAPASTALEPAVPPAAAAPTAACSADETALLRETRCCSRVGSCRGDFQVRRIPCRRVV